MASNTEHTTLVCLFHHTDRAERTVQELLEVGIPQTHITLIGHARSTVANVNSGNATLDSIDVPEQDRKRFQDGLHGGGSVVAVSALPGTSGQIEEIFKRYSADKIDEQVIGDNSGVPLGTVDASQYSSVVTSETVDFPQANQVITVDPPVVETIAAPPADEIDIAQSRRGLHESVVIAQPDDLVEDADGTEPTSATTFRFDPDAPLDNVRNPASDRLNDPLNRR